MTNSPDQPSHDEPYVLRLYVAGLSTNSCKAMVNLKRMCEEDLDSAYSYEIVDLLDEPKLAALDQIVAIPTLVRRVPRPVRKIIGDLSDTNRVMTGLQLLPAHR